MQHRIGLISDTHGLLRPEAVQQLEGCELIIHAGDVGKPEVLDQLNDVAPTIAVRGNVDTERWADKLKINEEVKIGEWSFHIIHDLGTIQPLGDDVNIVIYGHSHKYAQDYRDGVWYINPGSAGPRRFWSAVTMAILTLQEDSIAVDRIDLKP